MKSRARQQGYVKLQHSGMKGAASISWSKIAA